MRSASSVVPPSPSASPFESWKLEFIRVHVNFSIGCRPTASPSPYAEPANQDGQKVVTGMRKAGGRWGGCD